MTAVESSCRESAITKTAIHTVVCDVTEKLQVEEAILSADQMANETCGLKASILINCAGITRDAKVSNISSQNWEDVIGVNLKGTFHTCQAFCDIKRVNSLLINGTGGSIINIGSIVSKYGNVGQCNYSASKGGVVGLTRSLAKEMALLSYKIFQNNYAQGDMPALRVNCIQPGKYPRNSECTTITNNGHLLFFSRIY